MPCRRQVSKADMARFRALLDSAPTAKDLNKIVDKLRIKAAMSALKGSIDIGDFVDVIKKAGLEKYPWAKPENVTRVFGLLTGQASQQLGAAKQMQGDVTAKVGKEAKKLKKKAEKEAKKVAKQAAKLADQAQDQLKALWAKIPPVPVHELLVVFSLISGGSIEKKLKVIFEGICGSGASTITKDRIIALLNALGRGGVKLARKITGGKGKMPGGSLADRLEDGLDSDIGRRAIKMVAHKLFDIMDEDDDGDVEWDEFLNACLTRDSLFRTFFVWFDKTRARLSGGLPKHQEGDLKVLGGDWAKPTNVFVRLAKSGKKEKLQVFASKSDSKQSKALLTIPMKGELALHDCDTDDDDAHNLPKAIKKAKDTDEWFSLTKSGQTYYFQGKNREEAYEWWDELEVYATHVEEDEDSDDDDDLFTLGNARMLLFGGSTESDDSDSDSDDDSVDDSSDSDSEASDSDSDSESS